MKDFKKTLKALALLLGLALAMPFSAQAQTTKSMYHEGSLMDDPTAKWQSQGLMNDRTSTLNWTITNNGIGQPEAPLGSGLLILGAAGAGYAIAKRRKNKKNNKNGVALMLATLMLLGFTQCKKEVLEPIDGETVHITLRMEGNATRANVEPAGSTHPNWATVEFVSGDKLYVGNGGKYVGYLTYNGTDSWSGDITSPTTEDYLHLYFLGNKTPLSSVTAGTTTEFSVSISDQTSEYPVVSYNHTKELYNGEGTYSATTLYNKCSIMKFNVTTGTSYANDPIRITGMNNKVTVDFSKVAETGTGLSGSTTDNGFSYSVNSTDDGLIKMPAKDASNVTWAIVLPQDALAAADDAVYTSGYKGNRPAIAAIARNTYYDAGINLTITTEDNTKIKDLSTVTADWTAEDGWTLTGTLTENKKISIADGATVTLNNATINGTNNNSYKWAGITCLGNATIILSGTNTVKGFYDEYPGIYVPVGNTVTIKGSGSLSARSNGYSVGIGGGWGIACGNIEIQGGVITATGGYGCAGIGAGSGVVKGESICGTITISGGTVTAIGGESAAGIGSGYAQNNPSTCGAISISGGTVSATAGAYAPAAIGKGKVDTGESTCASVTIIPDITSLTLTNTNDVTGIVSDFINATAVYANTTPITTMLPTSVTDLEITMTSAGFATSYDGDAKTWTITRAAAPAPSYTMAAAATTSDKGKLICTAGHIHVYGEDAACTADRVAKIIYVGTNGHATYNHGLALALEDMSTKLTWDNSGTNNGGNTAAEWCSAWNTSKTVTDAEWLLASKDQWNYMMGTDGAGSYTDLRDGFTSVGGSNMKKGQYWSSTEDGTDNAWNCHFGNFGGGDWFSSYKNFDGYYVRACLAF